MPAKWPIDFHKTYILLNMSGMFPLLGEIYLFIRSRNTNFSFCRNLFQLRTEYISVFSEVSAEILKVLNYLSSRLLFFYIYKKQIIIFYAICRNIISIMMKISIQLKYPWLGWKLSCLRIFWMLWEWMRLLRSPVSSQGWKVNPHSEVR